MWWMKIDTSRLSRHGYIAYAYAAQKLGKYTPDIEKALTNILKKSDESWYWSSYADTAIFAQLLLERAERDRALILIDSLARDLDLTSYYVSTQEKIQTLLALITFSRAQIAVTTPLDIALR
jgi:hypothetical protein